MAAAYSYETFVQIIENHWDGIATYRTSGNKDLNCKS